MRMSSDPLRAFAILFEKDIAGQVAPFWARCSSRFCRCRRRPTSSLRSCCARRASFSLELGAQGSLYALATHVYPTAIRSTGMGAAAGFGRAGAIVSAYVGSAALAVGSGAFFGVVVVCLAITFVAVAVVNIHANALRSTAIR